MIEQAGTGDAVMSFLTTGQTGYIIGIDNDDSDAFKITQGQNNLGSGTTHFRYGRTGRLTLEGTDARLGVGTDSAGLQFHVEQTNKTVPQWACVPEYKSALEETLGPNALDEFKSGVENNLNSFNINKLIIIYLINLYKN